MRWPMAAQAQLRSRFLTDFAARKQVVVDSHGVRAAADVGRREVA